MVADAGRKVFLGQQLVMQMCAAIFAELGQVMKLAENFAALAGRVQRVAELQEVLDEIEQEYPEAERIGDTHPDELYPLPKVDKHARRAHEPHTDGWHDAIQLDERNSDGMYLPLAYPESGGKHIHGDDRDESQQPAEIRLEGVDIVTPRGQAICSNLSVTIAQGEGLVVTGRNAAGKTSLARVTSGLWPHTQGTVAVPTPKGSAVPGLRDVFVVPQRLHMFTGSLADQVTYPTAIPAAERTVEQEEHLQQLLDTVGIGYLVRRWAGDREDREDTSLGWDCVARWEDVLSLGEQQRLSVARMLYRKPTFTVLDECTSAVSIDSEERLYEAARASGTTCVTLSQRLSLPQLHTQQLRIGENNAEGWTLAPIESASQ